jgi:hypothetical protein
VTGRYQPPLSGQPPSPGLAHERVVPVSVRSIVNGPPPASPDADSTDTV